MPACPQCDPIQKARYEAGLLYQRLNDETAPLRARLEGGLKPLAEAVGEAMTALLQVEAEHAALVQAAAEMTENVAKMTGTGAFAVAGFNPADVSRQEEAGWIRVEVGPTTLWFRNAAAQEAYMRASGLAAALDALARLVAQREAALVRVRDANDRVNQANDALYQAEDRANEQLRAHAEQMAAADAEGRRLEAEYQACLERCKRGDVEDQRVGMIGLVLMMVGLTLVMLGNPFGAAGNAQAAGAVATATSAAAAGTTSTGTPAPTVTARVGPIRAVFNQQAFTTTYTLPVDAPSPIPGIDWRGADCGAFQVDSPTTWRWNHPHPPCDPSTDHGNRTIIATIQIGGALIECRYQGASSGTGPPCTAPGGTTVSPAGGGAAPAASSTASATATRPTGGGGSAPTTTATVTPSATPPSSGGGSTQTSTPTATATGAATPTVSAGGGIAGVNGSTATTLAGAALTALPEGETGQKLVISHWDGKKWNDQVTSTRLIGTDVELSVNLEHFSTYAVLYNGGGTAAPKPTAAGGPGTFSGTPIFSPTGQAFVVFAGGSSAQLEASAGTAGATGVWVQNSAGRFFLLVVRGPAFLRREFDEAFPTGFAGTTAMTLVR